MVYNYPKHYAIPNCMPFFFSRHEGTARAKRLISAPSSLFVYVFSKIKQRSIKEGTPPQQRRDPVRSINNSLNTLLIQYGAAVRVGKHPKRRERLVPPLQSSARSDSKYVGE